MIFQRYIQSTTLVRHCSTDFQKIREKYFKLEKCWEAVADMTSMTSNEIAIHEAHKDAACKCHFSYNDPISKEKVFTRYYHYLCGKCCGEGCRHCTYNYSEVPEVLKNRKKFNSSFWIDIPEVLETEKKVIANLKDLIRVKPKVSA